ncbi:DMT family transporter [Alkalicoccobacillus porphyridii]|uniref:DMT family transporter n=1 Tax=Alkalicoccobacillus porphyridii TaxID=2597270 RepID=A0A553ZVV7_9BACI|nr:DMT family transporter [Alkalicoccobacillus porphyridii]TSB45563.1 DMT family transporter [Alkalicoccobacillus porphyridii]
MKKGLILSVFSILIMSLTPLLNKFSLDYYSPVFAALLNSVFAGLFCYLYSLVIKERIRVVKSKMLWLIGLTNSIGLICLFVSLDLLSPITVGFVGRFYTIFAIMLAVFVLKEKLKRIDLVLIGLAIVGTFLFVEKGATADSYIGIAAALMYTLFFALTNTLVKKTVEGISSNTILFYNNLISVVLIAGFMIITGDLGSMTFQAEGIIFILLGAFFSGFLGLILFYESIKLIDFSLANLIRAVGPIVVALYSYWFFPIEFTVSNVAGAILILGSIVLITIKPKKLY